MDKAQALYQFWSSFGIPAIDEQSAYDEGTLDALNITFPYLSYETATDSFDTPVALSADLWYQSTSWAAISQKAEAISDYIGMGGRVIPYDNGAVWFTRGTPFAQRMAEDTGKDNIRRIHININAEFLSA